jgi:hypothetical protein
VPRKDRDNFDAMRCGASGLPISNKVLASDRLPFDALGLQSRMQAFTGMSINMRYLFGVRRTLLGIGFMAVLVSGFLSVLRATTTGRQPPANELSTGSIPRAAAVPKSPPGDPMVAFLSAASTQLTIPLQNRAAGRGAVPLPRPRPKRP